MGTRLTTCAETLAPLAPRGGYPGGGSLGARLGQVHQRLREIVPEVDRVACAIYDPGDGDLRTFVNSTVQGEPLSGYRHPLQGSPSLKRLSFSGDCRVIDDLVAALDPRVAHSKWVLDQGYRSSFTAPMFEGKGLLGFVFFDSRETAAFSGTPARVLRVFANLVNLTVAAELAPIRAILATARLARDFVDLRDFETGAHLERMARYARLIATRVGARHGLGDEFAEQVYIYAPLHDVGKIGIPDRVLLKPGPLDTDERYLMESHVAKGRDLVDKLLGEFGLDPVPSAGILRNIVAGHHERLDGSGYPRGLRGDDIPLEARIVAVADVLDALASVRPYKGAWKFEDACMELQRLALAGTLDSQCVAAVVEDPEPFRSIAERFSG